MERDFAAKQVNSGGRTSQNVQSDYIKAKDAYQREAAARDYQAVAAQYGPDSAEAISAFKTFLDKLDQLTAESADKRAALNKAEMDKWFALGDAIGKAASAFDEGVGANVQGLMTLAKAAMDIGTKIMAGDYIGAITTLVSVLADAIGGYQKVQREAAKANADIAAGYSIIDGSQFSKVKVVSRGWLADLFGGGPQLVTETNQVAVTIAKGLESGIKSGLSGALKNALAGGAKADGLKMLREGFYNAVLDGITNAIIEGALLKGAIGANLTMLTSQLAAGDYGGAAATVQLLAQQLPGIVDKITEIVAPITGVLKGLKPEDASKTAADAAKPTDAVQTSINGNMPSVQYGVLSIQGLDQIGLLVGGVNNLISGLDRVVYKLDGVADKLDTAVMNLTTHGSNTAGYHV